MRVCRYTAARMILLLGSTFLNVNSPIKPNHYWPAEAVAVVAAYAPY